MYVKLLATLYVAVHYNFHRQREPQFNTLLQSTVALSLSVSMGEIDAAMYYPFAKIISINICLKESTVNLAIIVRPSSKDTASLMHRKVHRASPHIRITLHQRRIRLSIIRLAKVTHSLAIIRPPAHKAHDAITTDGKL
jgi:hypothetical protein